MTHAIAQPHLLADAQTIKNFVMAGNATFTLKSKKTGDRFTYRVRKSKDGRIWFVSLMTGSDNESSYSYMGYVKTDGTYSTTSKSKISPDAKSAKAFNWFYGNVVENESLPDTLEVWHEGRCGRCHRKLTVPESIERGIGPECAHYVCGEC